MGNIITWSQKLNRQELHDACWIMGNYPERARMIEEHPVWSLLPIRYYNFGSWAYTEKHCFHTRPCFDHEITSYCEVSFCHTLAFFAQTLWERAAEIITQEYPDIMNLQFHPQTEDGIYPIVFQYDIEEIAEAQRRVMRKLISDGFSVDEFLRLEKVDKESRSITYRYEGVLEYSDDLRNAVEKTTCGTPLPVTPRNRVQYTYEECEEYYKTFNARMLVLGNQRRAYRYFEPQNHVLFEAARTGNKELLERMINDGCSLNEMSAHGNTAFFVLLEHFITSNDIRDITDADQRFLDFLIEHGANINLIGVDECSDPPLFYAVIEHADRLFRWLLEHGADPNADVIYDDTWDNGSKNKIQGWIDERFDEEDNEKRVIGKHQ